MLKTLGRGIKGLGVGIRMVGLVCLFVPAVIVTFVIDIVRLICLRQDLASSSTFMFTASLLGLLTLDGFDVNSNYDPLAYLLSSIIGTLVLLGSSIISTLIGIVVVCALGMPLIGAFLAAAWGAAIIVTLLGFGIEALSHLIINCASAAKPSSDYSFPQRSSYQNMTGVFPQHDPSVGVGVPVANYPSDFPSSRPPAVNPDYALSEERRYSSTSAMSGLI